MVHGDVGKLRMNSNPAEKRENHNDQEDQTHSSGWRITPVSAVSHLGSAPKSAKTKNTIKMVPSIFPPYSAVFRKRYLRLVQPLPRPHQSSPTSFIGVASVTCYCKLPVVALAGLPIASPDTTSSTLRFCCRPAALSFVATAKLLPKPLAVTELVATPCCTR